MTPGREEARRTVAAALISCCGAPETRRVAHFGAAGTGLEQESGTQRGTSHGAHRRRQQTRGAAPRPPLCSLGCKEGPPGGSVEAAHSRRPRERPRRAALRGLARQSGREPGTCLPSTGGLGSLLARRARWPSGSDFPLNRKGGPG